MARDYARLAAHLSPERCSALLCDGFVVVDDWFGAAWADALRGELLELYESGLLSRNKTRFASPTGAALLVSKPHIFEADLHDAPLRALFGSSLREFGDWFSGSSCAFAASLAAALPALQLGAGDRSRTVKLQVNEGGGAFPWHYDNPGPPNARALTLLVYLNPDWQPGDGGELELCPFLGAPVSVPPLHDRAVLFLSDRLLHRVTPSSTRRLAVTTWFDGAAVNGKDDVGLCLPPSALADVHATASMLRRSAVQRSLSRAVYADEYELSLRECMQGAQGEADMLAAHYAHIQAVQRNAPLARLVAALRHLKPQMPNAGDE